MTLAEIDISNIVKFPVNDPVLIFSLILLIIFISPLLLRKFHIPGIIFLIISGVIIGPHGLNIIEKSGAIDLFSTIGILFLMFIAGLNLDQQQLLRTRYKSLLFGSLTYIIPFSIGLPVCYYLLDYSFITCLMIANMFATHTMVSYPVVTRLGITRNEAVAVATGGTVITDTLVLLVLAAISGKTEGGDGIFLYGKLLVFFLIFLVILVYLVPPVSRWVFKRIEDDNYSQFIFVALIVFVCAIVAKTAGLEPIIGAFAAGLILNRLIPADSMLRNRIDFTGNALFIPFFLISVGMIVDLHGIFSGPTSLIVAAVLTTVALIGKWAAAHVSSMILGFNRDQRNLLFGLTTSHAAAILAVIMVGYRIGIIDHNVINGTILLILVTCFISSVVTESAGRKIALKTGDSKYKSAREYNESIIVSLSNPKNMERLLDLALFLKKKDHSQPLYGLCVVNDDEDAVEKLKTARSFLESVTSRAHASGRRIETLATIDNNISAGIKRVAREKDATDIIVGTSGKPNFADFIFGRSLEQLLDSATQNIFVYNPANQLNLYRKIHLFVPLNAEKETGFNSFINRIAHLSLSLSIPLEVKAKRYTCDIIRKVIVKIKSDADISYFAQEDAVTDKQPDPDDLIIFISPRRGSISSNQDFDSLMKKILREASANGYLIIYPGFSF
jgi:Kef-type K+ transport system membrane component KefB/nucleotide-binding universal stress UspA family protein